jgi:YHS domain-containing protein
MKTSKLMFLLALTLLGTGMSFANPSKGGPPANYPLTMCVVCDKALSEVEKPVKVTHDGTDAYLCSKHCQEGFMKEPAKFIKRVVQAPPKKS